LAPRICIARERKNGGEVKMRSERTACEFLEFPMVFCLFQTIVPQDFIAAITNALIATSCVIVIQIARMERMNRIARVSSAHSFDYL
jgi:hypothetical protein